MDGINGEGGERQALLQPTPSTSYSSIQQTDSDVSSSDRLGNNQPDMPFNSEGFQKCVASAKDELCGDSNPVVRYCQNFWTLGNLKSKFPVITWAPKYRMKHFIGDLVAGLTVGLTVIPQGMAYAQVADLPPQYGLYSSFMGGLLYCIFGTSKDITMGPTAIMSLLVAQFASGRAPTLDFAPIYAVVLTLMCGLIQLLMGLLNLGFIVQFISFPVISGFTSSAAILIGFSQIKKWLGLKDVPRDFIPQVHDTFAKLPETNLWDFSMGLVCIVLLVLMKKLKEFADGKTKTETNKVKRTLYRITWLICTARNAVIVVICAGIASVLVDVYGFKFNDDRSFLTLTGNVEEGIPTPQAPQFNFEYTQDNKTVTVTPSRIFSDIAEGFVVVPLIGLLESIAIAKAFARRNEYKIEPNQELIAIGVSNTLSSFFHSYPITGSFSRTAINSQSGVRTPAGGIWTGVTVLIALAVLTPYFYYIPQAALAAVIICAVIPMVEYEVVPKLFRVKKLDLLPLAITFFMCIFLHIEYGIMAGVAFSMLILIYPMSRPQLTIKHEKSVDVEIGSRNSDDIVTPKEAIIIEPNQGLKFPGIEYIKDKVMKHGVYEQPAKAIVLNATHFAGCDYTMVQGVTQVSEYFHKHNLQFFIACPSSEVRCVLENAEIKGLQLTNSVEEALRMAFAGGSMLASQKSGKLNEAYTVEINSESSSATGDERL